MSNINLQILIKERTILLEEIGALTHMVHGSIFERYTVCSRPECKCHKGEKHGPIMCFMINKAGKQHQKYVPKQMHLQAINCIKEYKRALEIIDRISEINLILIKEKNNA